MSPALVGGFFTTESPEKPACMHTYIHVSSYIMSAYKHDAQAWLIQFAEGMVVKAFQSHTRTTDCKSHFSLQTFSPEFDASFVTLPLCQMVRWLWSRELTMAKLHRAVDVWLMQKQHPNVQKGNNNSLSALPGSVGTNQVCSCSLLHSICTIILSGDIIAVWKLYFV